MEKVSVIVPIYNAEKYLKKCVDSILAQTHPNLQIILIDDGSTDSSPQICEQFREANKSVLVLHKENGGLVSARQAGLSVAAGSLIGWVDADDWVEPGYFEQLALVQEAEHADIVIGELFSDIDAYSKRISNGIPTGVYKREEILPKLLCTGEFFEYGIQPYLVTKLIKKTLLHQVQPAVNPHICTGEDAAVVYPSILKAQKIAVTDICGYHYVQHSGSLTKTVNHDESYRLRLLHEHLETAFSRENVLAVMRPQLVQYEKYLLLLRNIQLLDQQILLPFGGIPRQSRVVIYGAGGFGQQIYRYLSGITQTKILLWVDQNYRHYRNNGLDVHSPEEITNLARQYDYVLIANIVEKIAVSIRAYLLQLGVPEEKIRWLSEPFISAQTSLNEKQI